MTFPQTICLVTAARGFDLLTTYIAAPNLRAELNPFIRFLGWRPTLLLNLTFCALSTIYPPNVILWTVVLSVAAGAWNLTNLR